ncbi:glycosyltransferase [Butyrivibrio sp. DSM 10294]|uniref:glycosyltransferase n=1 Tax=Butyrivibrio sp. DSM 10294 TaxID=2972457 RepID=UPI00234F30C0|nr:glycosyltransferase [Butyrivibrio sp. DSM 10294]MDC7293601.1 glycosyltransferase [Butyrivibrio sp. DSM 10294]
MKKYSIIIPFLDKNENFKRTYSSILKQSISPDELEIIVICTVPDYCNELDAICCELNNSTIIIDAPTISTRADAFNQGIMEASGQYLLFMRAGDIIHEKFFSVLDEIIASHSFPDIVSFGVTKAWDEYEYFDDDPFSAYNFKEYCLTCDCDRKQFLGNLPIDERYYSMLYKTDFLREINQAFSEDIYDDDITFAYPLFLFADSVVFTKDHGYCRYDSTASPTSVADRIAANMTAQTNLLQLLQNIPNIYAKYKDSIDAHFVQKYYLYSLWLGRISGEKSPIKISIFQVLQYVMLQIVPKWIENEFIYNLGRKNLDTLSLINKTYSTQGELDADICENNLVSVIITTHNRQEYLGTSIKNILAQSYQAFELIIVDDASSDETEQLVKSFSDKRIKYIKNETNKGITATRNIGLKAATSNYVAYHDDDDLCRLDKLEKEMAMIWASYDSIKAVYPIAVNHARRIRGHAQAEAVYIPSLNKPLCKKDGFIFPVLLYKNDLQVSAMLIEKRAALDIGGFDESIYVYEDWEFILRFSQKYYVRFINEPLYDYYQRQSGLASSPDSEHRRKLIQALYTIDQKYAANRKKYGVESTFIIREVD